MLQIPRLRQASGVQGSGLLSHRFPEIIDNTMYSMSIYFFQSFHVVAKLDRRTFASVPRTVESEITESAQQTYFPTENIGFSR